MKGRLPTWLICWPLLWLAIPGLLQAQGAQVSFRVPFKVDLDETLLSSMLLELTREPVNKSARQLLEERITVRENAVSELFHSLLEGEVAAMEELAVPDNSEAEDWRQVSPALVNIVSKSGAKDLQLIAEYPLTNQRSIMAWRPLGVPAERNLYLHLEWDQEGQSLQWHPSEFEGPQGALSSLLVEIERDALQGKKIEVPLEAKAYRFSSPFGDLKAKLHFNGKAYRWNVGSDKAPPGAVTEFYKNAYHALLTQGPSSYADFFTAESRNTIKKWHQTFEPGQEEIFLRDLKTQNRHVVFVLDADPCFLVFYNTFNAGPSYDIVVRDPASGDLRLTNFQMFGSLDLLLKDKEHFWKRIISPLASRGPDADEQLSMPVVPGYLVAEREENSELSPSPNLKRRGGPSLPGPTNPRNSSSGPAEVSPPEGQPKNTSVTWWILAAVLAAGIVLIIANRRQDHA